MEFLNSVLAILPIQLIWSTVVGITVYWYLTKDFGYWKRYGIPYVEGIPFFGSVLQMLTKPAHDVDLENYLKLGRIFGYLTKNYDYWKRYGIPYVVGIPFFGNVLELLTKPIHDVEVTRYFKLGRIYGLYEGQRPVLTVGEPDILKDIFVKDFPVFTGRRRTDLGLPVTDNMVTNLQGEHWKRVRTILTPAFSTGKIKKMISIFTDSAKTLASNLRAAAKEGKHIDAKRLFGAFTMDVIASSAFATKIDSHNDPANRFVTAASAAFRTPFPWRIALFSLFPGLMRFFHISKMSPSSVKFFEQVTLQLVEERKRTKQKRNDFLQLMLDAVEREAKDSENVKESEEISEIGHEETNEKIFTSYQSNKSLSSIELVANSIIFFLAGYETTATTLGFTVYELAVNSDIQERVIREIDETIRQKGGINYEALCEMKYLDNVIYETLRKYPPAVRIDRLAEEEYEIKDPHSNINFTVPKGMLITIPIYAVQHDPEHYPNPEKFDPDRFSPEQKSTRHPYTFIPFGAGPRNCIGMRFALMEIKVCLAVVLSQFRFNTCAETKIPLEFHAGRLMQAKDIAVKVEIRTDGNKI